MLAGGLARANEPCGRPTIECSCQRIINQWPIDSYYLNGILEGYSICSPARDDRPSGRHHDHDHHRDPRDDEGDDDDTEQTTTFTIVNDNANDDDDNDNEDDNEEDIDNEEEEIPKYVTCGDDVKIPIDDIEGVYYNTNELRVECKNRSSFVYVVHSSILSRICFQDFVSWM
jgi:hypothetical protein